MNNAIVVIPAYRPDKRLVEFADALNKGGFPIVAVDDGSGGAYTHIFDALKASGATVLRHAENRGKGAAMKTAFSHILKTGEGLSVVTADADGQHLPKDVAAVADALQNANGAVILGARDVMLMPPRSRAGNLLTRKLMHLLMKMDLSDTQTGLRGFPAALLGPLIEIPGVRYEYEMNVLLNFHRRNVPIVEIPIETVYIDQNRASHFRPVKDGLDVLRPLIKYLLAALGCTGLDFLIYTALSSFLIPAASYASARIVSASLNYQLLRRKVFAKEGSAKRGASYFALAACSMAAGSALTQALSFLGFHSVAAKLVVDLLLFLVNYFISKMVIFRS